MPSRNDIFLGGIFLIMVVAALRLGSDMFLPLTAAYYKVKDWLT